MNFYILMDGRYSEGSYAILRHPETSVPQLFVVARIGDVVERIYICFVRERLDASLRVPEIVSIDFTLTGVLAMRNDDAGCETFLLDQTTPANIAIEGRFQPSDGYARINYEGRFPELEATGRFPRSTSTEDAGPSTFGGSWHLQARRVPWSHEILI